MKKRIVLLMLVLGLGSCGAVKAQVKEAPPVSPVSDLMSSLMAMDSYGTSLSLASMRVSDVFSAEDLAGYKADAQKASVSIGKIPGLYDKLFQSAGSGDFALSHLLLRYAGSLAGTKSAAQVSQVADQSQVEFLSAIASQNQILIQQNQKMIALLTKIANKK